MLEEASISTLVPGEGQCCERNAFEACEHDDAYIRGLLADLGPSCYGDGDGVTIMGARVADCAAALAEEPTGFPLACLLAQVDLAELEAFSLVDAVADWTRVASWAQTKAGEAAAMLEVRLSDTVRDAHAVPPSTPDRRNWPEPVGPRRAATAELALRLATTRPRAQDIVETGTMLNEVLSATGDALERGEIDFAKAQIFARHLATVPVEIALEVENLILPRAPRLTPPQLEKEITKALLEVDPGEAQLRHQAAVKKRRVNHPRALPEGMASIYAVLPAQHATAFDLALDAAARTARAHGDDRTTDQLRADAMTTMGVTALSTGAIAPSVDGASPPRLPGGTSTPAAVTPDVPELPRPEMPAAFAAPEVGCAGSGLPTEPASGPGFPLGSLGGVPARINVTVPLDTLLGGDAPADLEGYGPITATAARALAAGGTWRRLVTDPLSGVVTDVGRTRYRPPSALADLVRARDRTCTRPGCNVRAEACDLDHTVPWGGESGGLTSLGNLRCLCPADHALKSSGDFRVSLDPDGRTRWTTPTGHSYVRNPDATMTHELVPAREHPTFGAGPPPF